MAKAKTKQKTQNDGRQKLCVLPEMPRRPLDFPMNIRIQNPELSGTSRPVKAL
jgi:hypothetical protein